MLCKQRKIYNVEKLCVIQLVEVDLCMFLQLTWGKTLVGNILQINLLLLDQFGSRPSTLE